jgi:hypothetical protein
MSSVIRKTIYGSPVHVDKSEDDASSATNTGELSVDVRQPSHVEEPTPSMSPTVRSHRSSRKSVPKRTSEKARDWLACVRDELQTSTNAVVDRFRNLISVSYAPLQGPTTTDILAPPHTFTTSSQAVWQIQPCRFHKPRCNQMAGRYAHLCDEHAVAVYGVQIKSSTERNAGEGLFAARTIRKNDIIDIYAGPLLTAPEFNTRYPDGKSEYGVAVEIMGGDTSSSNTSATLTFTIDASGTQSCVSRYINQPADLSKINVAFVLVSPAFFGAASHSFYDAQTGQMKHGTDAPIIAIRALHDIAPGAELFVYYGAKF